MATTNATTSEPDIPNEPVPTEESHDKKGVTLAQFRGQEGSPSRAPTAVGEPQQGDLRERIETMVIAAYEYWPSRDHQVASSELINEVEALVREREEAAGGCPCLVIEPCQSMCTCAHPFHSGGCLRCAQYGSTEQRQAAARRIAIAVDLHTEARLRSLREGDGEQVTR